MKANLFIAVASGMLVICGARGATFTSLHNGAWNTAGTWDRNAVPGRGDHVVIVAGHEVTLSYPNTGSCESVDVRVNGEAVGALRINGGTTLTLGDTPDTSPANSIVDGRITFEGCVSQEGCQRVLHVLKSLTIEGTGEIRGANNWKPYGDNYGTVQRGEITTASGAILTIQDATIVGDIDLKARLKNQGTVLVDDKRDGVTLTDKDRMVLSTKKKSGNGTWKCVGGNLFVEYKMAGTGDWYLDIELDNPQEVSDSLIWIEGGFGDTNTSDLGGDVAIEDGTFKTDIDFCTTGEITYESSSSTKVPEL